MYYTKTNIVTIHDNTYYDECTYLGCEREVDRVKGKEMAIVKGKKTNASNYLYILHILMPWNH